MADPSGGVIGVFTTVAKVAQTLFPNQGQAANPDQPEVIADIIRRDPSLDDAEKKAALRRLGESVARANVVQEALRSGKSFEQAQAEAGPPSCFDDPFQARCLVAGLPSFLEPSATPKTPAPIPPVVSTTTPPPIVIPKLPAPQGPLIAGPDFPGPTARNPNFPQQTPNVPARIPPPLPPEAAGFGLGRFLFPFVVGILLPEDAGTSTEDAEARAANEKFRRKKKAAIQERAEKVVQARAPLHEIPKPTARKLIVSKASKRPTTVKEIRRPTTVRAATVPRPVSRTPILTRTQLTNALLLASLFGGRDTAQTQATTQSVPTTLTTPAPTPTPSPSPLTPTLDPLSPQPFNPLAPIPSPSPFSSLAPPKTGSKTKECQEVKRRRRRKGKCREGFFKESANKTRFITWRTTTCQ